MINLYKQCVSYASVKPKQNKLSKQSSIKLNAYMGRFYKSNNNDIML